MDVSRIPEDFKRWGLFLIGLDDLSTYGAEDED